MELRCPDCRNPEVAPATEPSCEALRRGDCGASFGREQAPVTTADAEALDVLAAQLNEPGEWNGGDVCELAADLLRRTGRPIDDEPS